MKQLNTAIHSRNYHAARYNKVYRIFNRHTAVKDFTLTEPERKTGGGIWHGWDINNHEPGTIPL